MSFRNWCCNGLRHSHIGSMGALYAPEHCGASCVAGSRVGNRPCRSLTEFGKGLNMATSSTSKGTKKTSKAATAPEATVSPSHTAEAKSRFNAALDEAKAGAAELAAEAKERGAVYRDTARTKGEDWTVEAKTKASE